jgi:hypothetical protein
VSPCSVSPVLLLCQLSLLLESVEPSSSTLPVYVLAVGIIIISQLLLAFCTLQLHLTVFWSAA